MEEPIPEGLDWVGKELHRNMIDLKIKDGKR